VDGGPTQLGIESTVVKVVNEEAIEILRPGAVSIEMLSEKLGPKVQIVLSHDSPTVGSPGMLASHYAPLASVEILSSFEFDKRKLMASPSDTFFSVPDLGTDIEAASKLYSELRRLDSLKPSKIFVLLGNEKGLGLAINDRLRRAAKK
jgi:L-threonylcarbamoyladenylate synthase